MWLKLTWDKIVSFDILLSVVVLRLWMLTAEWRDIGNKKTENKIRRRREQ